MNSRPNAKSQSSPRNLSTRSGTLIRGDITTDYLLRLLSLSGPKLEVLVELRSCLGRVLGGCDNVVMEELCFAIHQYRKQS